MIAFRVTSNKWQVRYFLIEFFRRVSEEMEGESASIMEMHEPSKHTS
jgi:hypothetical protein